MGLKVNIEKSVTTAAKTSDHVLQVACMFGLGIDQEREEVIVPPTEVPVPSGEIVFITGASGSGKSTILKLIHDDLLNDPSINVINFNNLGNEHSENKEHCIIDGFGDAELSDVLRWLSIAGLNDAFVMLRKPCELSDGQRYRLQLAKAIGEAEYIKRKGKMTVVIADEFGATLDRVTAKVISKNLQRWVKNTRKQNLENDACKGVCVIVATTHDDLMEALEPSVLIDKELGGKINVYVQNSTSN